MALTSLYVEPAPAEDEREPPALELLDVFRIFSSGTTETVALKGLSLKVPAHSVTAVYGPSGSGKSTCLHLAAGLDTPSAGEVRAFGRPLDRMDEQQLSRHRARTVAIVFQRDNLWSSLTALENVEMALRLGGSDDVAGPARAALEQFGLKHRMSHRPASLSGGEQQRVAIAAAAARRAPLVLADEPTGELDSANERLVIDALLGLRDTAGSTAVVVTHSPRVRERADDVIELRDGRAT